jgi:putative transposase
LRHERARFTEEQIIGVLKEHEAGAKTADPARKYGVSEATPYNWKAKYGGIYVSEAKRLKQLEDENAKLKTSVAGQAAQLCQNLTRRRAQGNHSPGPLSLAGRRDGEPRLGPNTRPRKRK